MKKEEKTNVMRVLDAKKIAYESHTYEPDATLTGQQIAGILGEEPEKVFKTLVTQGKSGGYYVFVVPVAHDLDLKKCAKAVNEKSIEMLPLKELTPLTGYVRGGCSPIGMKKAFKTVVNDTALGFDTIIFSGGKIGVQVEVSPNDLSKLIQVSFADILED